VNVDVKSAARRWAETWQRAWPAKDVEAIASLYAEDALYRALVFREPDRGVAGVRRYLAENFAIEEDVECRFGESIARSRRRRPR
jgi:ketosteroid isomerase-like protein